MIRWYIPMTPYGVALPLPFWTRHSVLAASPSPKDDGMGSALRTERQDVMVHEDKKKLVD